MTRLIRWLLTIATGVAAVLVAPGSPAAAATVVDGAELRYLPAGIGSPSDFAYEYDDVSFASRVWESGSDATGWRVDLKLAVLRGAALTDAVALRDWYLAYQERPPEEVRYVRTWVHGSPGWLARDEVFWLVRPGVAVAVRLDRTRWSLVDLVRTAWGVRGP